MRALIWKELRENWRWALLGAIALGGAEIFALHHSDQPGAVMDVYFNSGITLCKKQFLAVTLFGSALAGLALGLLQVLPELGRDRWAALLHRPVPRGRFFGGKAVAGVLLYLLMAGVPFATCVWLVATPGHFATPFTPRMVLPGMADLLGGLAYYLAGLLIGLEGRRWYLRALPLLAATHVSIFALDTDAFRVAVEAYVAMGAVMALAGRGAMHARTSLTGRGVWAQMAFLIVAFYGACGLGDLAKLLAPMLEPEQGQSYSGWEILDNGRPVKITHHNGDVVSALDIHGQPFAERQYSPDQVRGHTLGMNAASQYVGDRHGWKPRVWPNSYRSSSTYLYSVPPYQHPRFEQWFWLTKERVYVGMLPMEKREFATLTADGFADAGRREPGLAAEVTVDLIRGDLLALVSPDAVRFAALAHRTIQPITLPAPGPNYGTGHSWAWLGGGSVDYLGVALGSGFAALDTKGQTAAFFPYRHDVDRWGALTLGILKSNDRFVLRYAPSEWIPWETREKMPSYVDLLDAQGRVVETYTLPAVPQRSNPESWSNHISRRLHSPGFYFGEMAYRGVGAAFGSERLRKALQKQWGKDRDITSEISAVVVVVALVLAGVTWHLSRRAQMRPAAVKRWTGLVLLFGPAGFVAFLVAAERPQTVTCATCGKPRRVEEERCDHCGAPWPVQAADGTEILEARPAALAAA